MILNGEQHTVLELLRIYLVKDDVNINLRAIEIIDEILMDDTI